MLELKITSGFQLDISERSGVCVNGMLHLPECSLENKVESSSLSASDLAALAATNSSRVGEHAFLTLWVSTGAVKLRWKAS